jgi:rhodanese-related sulfurtransferase
MSAHTLISPDELAGLIGSPKGPILIDVRPDEDCSADPYFVPGTIRRDHASVAQWATGFAGRSTVVISRRGSKLGQGVAAWLRHAGAAADTLEGGHEAWAAAGLPLVPEAKLPPRDSQGRTIWVTRSRPKVDRIACPWLIRRFVDPNAVFLFVAASEVAAVADNYGAAPFDIEGAFWGHRGERCTFDALVEELGLETDALRRLAVIVRGADTGRPDIAPESAGLLAASMGLSRLYSDDLEQLEAGLALYDAFYRWSRAVDAPNGKSGNTR